MTAIAAFSYGPHPIVFGDLLLTSPSTQRAGVSVPALGDVSDFFGGDYAIQGLRQKVCVIHDHCVLAWAGSWLSAAVAISELRERLRTEALGPEDIEEFFESHPDVRKHGNAFVGFVWHQGRMSVFRYGAKTVDTPTYGRVYCPGSGVHAIEDLVTHFSQAIRGTLLGGGGNGFDYAHAVGLMFGAVLLKSEFHGGDAAITLRALFGGGYEVAGFEFGKFAKIPETTFFVYTAESHGEEFSISLPQLIVKQTYFSSYLGIRTLRRLDSANEAEPVQEFHVVAPMFDEQPPADLEGRLRNTPFESKWSVHCIAVKGKGILTFFDKTALGGSPKVTVNCSATAAEIKISQDFLNDIRNQAKGMRGRV